MREYQHWLQKQDYAGWTIVTRLQAVRRFFDHLEATQAVLLNPCFGPEPPKIPYRLPKTVLTTEEARRVLDTPSRRLPSDSGIKPSWRSSTAPAFDWRR